MFRTILLFCLIPFLSFAAFKQQQDVSSFVTPHFLTSFEECFIDASSKVAIRLSDGSIWYLKEQKQKTSDQLMTEILKNWKIGDDIRIEKEGRDFILKNVHQDTTYIATLDLQHTDSPITLTKIDQSGYVLLTSDGSQWVTGWLGYLTMSDWRPGDHLTINKGDFSIDEDFEDYFIINRHTGSTCWCSLIIWN